MTKKLALITGASGGIGAAIARAASREGYRVALLDVQAEAVKKTALAIENAQAFRCDISDQDAVETILNQIGGVPDLLVNNAGIVKFYPILEIALEDFRRVLDVNLTGAFIVSQAVAKRMRDSRKIGNIINISSIGGITPSLGTNAYAAGKAGLVKLTELMALELGPLGIRVNAVSPGFIDGGMSTPIYANPKARASRTQAVPLRRLGSEEDIAEAVMFLASSAAAYITGHNLVVDGALTHSVLSQIPRD
ncbi:MAG: SDR family NAD(P)-dependent oxidoreductase [Gallionella sp.]|nr:SDR family NAD(P)-dependent oxidoreductase [Gallionella sp.]